LFAVHKVYVYNKCSSEFLDTLHLKSKNHNKLLNFMSYRWSSIYRSFDLWIKQTSYRPDIPCRDRTTV